MDIKQLSYFLGIVEEGSITRAAEKLHIAQPHLSLQLKLLEEELGVRLIERNTRRIQVTDAGWVLHRRAHQIVDLLDTAARELSDFREGLHGTLSIATIATAGAAMLQERIRVFHTRYPGIRFEIRKAGTPQIYEMLKSGQAEIGIVRTPFRSEDVQMLAMPDEPMVAAYGGDDYWPGKTGPMELAELAEVPLLVERRYEAMISEAANQAGFEPNIICSTEEDRLLLLWAESRMGVAVLPRTWLEMIPNLGLFTRELNALALNTSTAVIWMKNRYLSSAARHFIETFEKQDENAGQ
ncbi:MAG: LysR family transcriptional regulator [Solirubrobacterales bacterium]